MVLVPHGHRLHGDDTLTGPVVGRGDSPLCLLLLDVTEILAAPLHRHQLPLSLSEGAHQAGELPSDSQGVADGETDQAGVCTGNVVLYHSYDRHAAHHGTANHLQPQLQPLGGRLARVVGLQAALQPLHVLPHKPGHGLHGSDGGHPGQGLAVVGVDGRHGHTADRSS